jgi:hypothetical protein
MLGAYFVFLGGYLTDKPLLVFIPIDNSWNNRELMHEITIPGHNPIERQPISAPS